MVKSEYLQFFGKRHLYYAGLAVVWPIAGEVAFFVSSFFFVSVLKDVDRPPGRRVEVFGSTVDDKDVDRPPARRAELFGSTIDGPR
eukprot:CAMPEP_0172627008 /NCGR_PEP_ID=MMETSP1068-20121228/153877_1 /TAXON_ID=35684 /ORGANISM="Pseudopedinella elastica, Strain CCMP716" /LENGTH=85 /DNA_ID=CAMNT_0013436773 /DNA_START=297 /DNA_END=554 /DNA_ORIENTATION=+